MTGRKALPKRPHQPLGLLFPLAALMALGGAAGAGHAETLADDAATDAEFAQAFAPVADWPNEPVARAHAVDITAIEPAPAQPLGEGVASFYGKRFAGRPTASGEAFDPADYTAAHRTLPFGSRVRVTNPRNGRSTVVRINDRGPFTGGRTIDLSRAAAEEIGIVAAGHGTVELELLS